MAWSCVALAPVLPAAITVPFQFDVEDDEETKTLISLAFSWSAIAETSNCKYGVPASCLTSS